MSLCEERNDESSSCSSDVALAALVGIGVDDFDNDAWENESVSSLEPRCNSSPASSSHSGLKPSSMPNATSIAANLSSTCATKGMSEISHRAYALSPEGRLVPVPVQVAATESRGNILLATRNFVRGEVLFIEKAAVSVQLNRKDVRSCYSCMRSLESAGSCALPGSTSIPLPNLWPVKEVDFQNSRDMKNKAVHDFLGPMKCFGCDALFCGSTCFESVVGQRQCCLFSESVKAIEKVLETTENEGFAKDVIHSRPELLLGIVLFLRKVLAARDGRTAVEDGVAGMCGTATDIHPLELGVFVKNEGQSFHTVKPIYEGLCSAIRLTDEERRGIASCDVFAQLVAVAARNCFHITTQSPFKTYYAGLLRTSGGRNTPRHKENIVQLAKALGSNDGTLTKEMDREIDARVACSAAAIFSLISRINHSCDPNAAIKSQEFVDNHVALSATRDIKAGEEILISYINLGRDEGRKSTMRRRNELRARYLFDCACTKCSGKASV